MSGVADAFTIDDILSPSDEDQRALRKSLDPRSCGDIIVRFTPGWSVVYDEQTPPVTKQRRESAVMTPAFLKAPGLKPQVITSGIDATALAPTLAGVIRIRAPNGAASRAVPVEAR